MRTAAPPCSSASSSSRVPPGTQVWARNTFRRDVLWPALIANAHVDAPETVRKSAVPGRLCVMYLGPSNSATRKRDWYWKAEEDIYTWTEAVLEEVQGQLVSQRDRQAFQEALQEGRRFSQVKAQARPTLDATLASSPSAREGQHVHCTSCGKRIVPGEALASDGGRCCHCIRLSMEGHCCNVCWRPWIQNSDEMVACDRCHTWVHTECDPLSTIAIEAARRGHGCHYFCPSCRLSMSPHDKNCLAHEYESRVREFRPTSRPETPMGLLAAEISRKYLRQNIHVELPRLVGLADEMWRVMKPEDKKVYQDQAKRLGEGHMKKRALYEGILVEYKRLLESVGSPVPQDLDIDITKLTSLGVKRRSDTSLEGMRNQKQPCVGPTPVFPPRFDRNMLAQWRSPIGHQRNSAFSHFNPLRIKDDDYDYVTREQCGDVGMNAINSFRPNAQNGIVQKIPIVCNGIHGTFLLGLQRVICSCSTCANESPERREFTATQFEQHCGAGSAKKWKASLRIQPGTLPEVPKDAAPLALGKYFGMKGIEPRVSKTSFSKPPHPGIAPRSKAPEKCAKEKKVTNGKCKSDKKADEMEPWRQVDKGGYTTIQVCYAGDRCSACDSDVDYDCDQLITCDGCGMCVHQTCYGVPEAPKNDEIWKCAVCANRKEGEPPPRCCLCPIEGGALKPVDIPGLWAHVACMQWIPEVTVGDPARMEPIKRVTHIQKERWELPCSLCKQKMGAKIQCLQCYSTYHPLCARMAGLHMEMQEGRAGPTGPWRLVTYCPRHCKPRPELSGVHKVKSAAENGVIQLFNRQPFKQPPAVELPACPAGSARAQPLSDWVRTSHGTGAGYSSEKAFWIPQPPLQVFRIPSSTKDVPGKGQKIHQRPGRPRTSSRRDRRPVGPVDLLPLPKGVPESITVECNGRKGTLFVRSQRVLYMDEETTASRFEQICGKGEAKKWKCSLWYVGENEEQPMQMQDWLIHMNLDRKVLSNLQSNLAAYNMYQQYLESQVEEVVDEIVDAVDTGRTCTILQTSTAAADCSDNDLDVGGNVDLEGPSTRPTSSTGHSSDGSHSEQTVTHHEINLETSVGRGPGQEERYKPGPSESQSKRPLPIQYDRDCRMAGTSKTEPYCESLADVNRGQSDPQNSSKVGKVSIEDADFQTDSAIPDLHGSERNQVDTVPSPQASKKIRSTCVRLGSRALEAEATSVVRKCMLRRTSSQIGPSPSEPASCINLSCQLYWPDDDEWYSAVVKEHRDNTADYRVLYDVDQQEEWLDLQVEMEEGRLRWTQDMVQKETKSLDAPTSSGDVETLQRRVQRESVQEVYEPSSRTPEAHPDREHHHQQQTDSAPSGRDAVDMKISIWWGDDSVYYPGIVIDFDEGTGKHHIHYDDGDEEWLELSKEHVIWDAKQVQQRHRAKSVGCPPTRTLTESDALVQSGTQAPNSNVPDEVSIVCNGMEAEYKVKKTMVVLKDGSEMTPTEFERVAGKGASKKWKASIRVLEINGSSGNSLGEWLIDQGLDALKSRTSRSSEEEHKRPRKKNPLESDRRRPRHRQNCMCIICKQARRKGGNATQQSAHQSCSDVGKGSQANSLKADTPQSWRPATTAAAARAVGPRIRSGKRAYVLACPQLIRGPSTHTQQEVPFSRYWTPDSFEQEKRLRSEKIKQENAPVSAEGIQGSREKDEDARRAEALDRRIVRTKLESWRIQLKECKATERERIVFGKSGIHGWGLFARKQLEKDSMIIEYRGEVVGPAVADLREKKYKEQGKDCYLFHISEDCVIDATVTGALGRFTNHSCAPSMYTKILHVDGEYHLCFFSRYEILPGQELTYDYRFKEEAAESKIACQCGAPNCRGFMN